MRLVRIKDDTNNLNFVLYHITASLIHYIADDVLLSIETICRNYHSDDQNEFLELAGSRASRGIGLLRAEIRRLGVSRLFLNILWNVNLHKLNDRSFSFKPSSMDYAEKSGKSQDQAAAPTAQSKSRSDEDHVKSGNQLTDRSQEPRFGFTNVGDSSVSISTAINEHVSRFYFGLYDAVRLFQSFLVLVTHE